MFPAEPEVAQVFCQTLCLDRVAGMLRDPGKVVKHFAHSLRGHSPAKQCVWIEWPEYNFQHYCPVKNKNL